MSQKLPFDYSEGPSRVVNDRGRPNYTLHPLVDTKQKENVVRRLTILFQESFDIDLIQSVAQTCQWDLGKSTEALIVLGGTTQPTSKRSRRINSLMDATPRYKTKSLPSTLKGNKSQSGRLSDSSTHSMPNGLRAHPAYVSSDSLAGGQVWQRHYKSKPQSPGLLTMIPPLSKEAIKLQKPASSRSSSRPSSRPSSRASSIRELPEVKKTSAVILRIQQLVQNNVKVMVLMRGVPGSGKTHLAQVVVGMVTENNASQHILSTDDYFLMMGRGSYEFDASQLAQAHNWNQKRVSEALRRATNPIVVDNTHTQAWEMRPYVTMAVQQGYLIEVLEPVTPWKTKEAELARRNVHNVPREKIRQMLDRYELGWTGEKLLSLFQLKYQHCGAAHVSPKVTAFTDSPLAQHRQQHTVLEQPEKPRRKKGSSSKKDRKSEEQGGQKASPAKKDRRQVPGVDINVTQEQQLEELNKLFAEYGKTMDPESRQKVIDAGVPIFEVVSRIRKLQGTLLPMPSVPPAISEEGPGPAPQAAAAPDYLGLHRHSPTDSVEPDTMSSSNVSETSDCESDSEEEPIRRYLDDCVGRFVDGEDDWDDEEEAKSDGAVGGKPSGKMSAMVTSSQEELSIIDYQLSTPAGSSMDELSLLDLERPPTPNGSSSSSEEPKTELSTLQSHSSREQVGECGDTSGAENDKNHSIVQHTANAIVDINDSLLEILRQRRFAQEDSPPTPPKAMVKPEPAPKPVIKPEIPVKGEHLKAKSSKSPDLEQIPLPCIPEVDDNVIEPGISKLKPCKLETIEEVLSNMASPPEICSNLEGKEKSPTGILKIFDLSWASIPFTDSWEKLPPPEHSLPQRNTNTVNVDKQTYVRPSDFQQWTESGEQVIIRDCKPRMINSADVPVPVRSKVEVAMFDKSSMTDEEATVEECVESGLEDLMPMFPEVPKAVLADLLEKCEGDKLWVADILLDPSFTFEDVKYKAPAPIIQPENEPEADVDQKLESLIADGKKTIKRRKDKKAGASELSLLLKKEIEESFQIGAEHYTDNLLFLKKLRNGEVNFDVPEEPKVESVAEKTPEEAPTTPEESDIEEATVPMALEPTFLRSLIEKFGTPTANVCESIQCSIPVINVPESIARQIYWLWVESVNQQVAEMIVNYESQVTEDELLATALQDLELSEQPPKLQEIMDMELARSISMKEQQNVSTSRGADETAASRLARQLLLEAYPEVGKDTLIQFYRSEGRSLRRTLEVLTKIYGPPKPAQPFVESVAQTTASSVQNLGDGKPMTFAHEMSNFPKASDVLVIDPSAFRLEIQDLFTRRQMYRKNGQEAHQKKNYAVASNYFQMAREISEKIHHKTNTCIPAELFSTSKKLSTAVDLHFLLVHEALQVVDLFLDHHIANLQAGRLDLFFITGRGLRSHGGRSRIKPVVQKRLYERRLGYSEDNPGMLRVTIHPNDMLSSAL